MDALDGQRRERQVPFATGLAVRDEFCILEHSQPVTVVESEAPRRIVIEWDGVATTGEKGTTRVTFTFEPIDDDTRTLVTITESSWLLTTDGATHAFGNCEGWTGMLAALKAWVEHGINLRDGFYK